VVHPLASKVIVVDNSSTDKTAERAREAGAHVVQEEKRGYGYACLRGTKEARDADVIVFLASEQACWLTGQLLYVGGGWRMHQ